MREVQPLAWIPNEAGYQFWGLTHDLRWVRCEVVKNENGLHTLKDGMFQQLRGWVTDKQAARMRVA